MKLVPLLTFVALATACALAAAQTTIYRCGNDYSGTACPNAQTLLVASAVTAEQRAEARAVATREKALAADMARDRRAEEAGIRPALASSLSAPPPVVAARPVKKVVKKRKKVLLPDDERDFLAAVPKAKKARS
jgi:hypothetical protein